MLPGDGTARNLAAAPAGGRVLRPAVDHPGDRMVGRMSQ